MHLNDEQSRIVSCDGDVCICACPGSGKTRTIVGKLLRCVEDVQGTPRKLACITYTHTAVDEIEKRVREYGDGEDQEYFEIGTIHSFCLNNILRPFHYRIAAIRTGFKVFAPDSSEWHDFVHVLGQKYGVDRRRLDYFGGIQREPGGEVFVPQGIPREAATEFVEHLDRHGLVTFPDIVYHCSKILDENPFVARGLASRFAWMLIDEFQDTTAAQVAVLRSIAKFGLTKFFMVGDPNQSIMSFAGAHPFLMRQFPRDLGAKTDTPLSGNYRCSDGIVALAERLLPTSPRMRAVGPSRDFSSRPEYVHADSCVQGIIDHFLPAVRILGTSLGNAAILAPWWTTLYHLAGELRDAGVPIIGPGARPYRRTNLFAGLAECLCACTEDKSPDLFRATQRALFIMLLNLEGETDWRVYTYDGRRTLCRIRAAMSALREKEDSAIDWLRAAAVVVQDILVEEGFTGPSATGLVPQSVEDMVGNMVQNDIDIAALRVRDLALYARPRECLNLLTMHGAKGREFDAVAVVDLHEGRVPDFRATTEEDIAEDRRQLYVAITRAKKVLMLITDSSHYRNRPSRFLADIGMARQN